MVIGNDFQTGPNSITHSKSTFSFCSEYPRGSPPFVASLLRWSKGGQDLVISSLPGDRSNLWRIALLGSEPSLDQLASWVLLHSP